MCQKSVVRWLGGIALLFGLGFVSIMGMSCSERSQLVMGPVMESGETSPIKRPDVVPMRLHNDARKAIQLECFYALSRNINGSSSKTLNGSYVSDWAYLLNDINAYTRMKDHYGYDFSSVWEDDRFPSFFLNMDYYSFMKEKWTSAGAYSTFTTKYGRGAQCRYFANLILYRSGVMNDGPPKAPFYLETYNSYINDYNGARKKTRPIYETQVGDVIQTKWSKGGHTAIVIHIVAWDSQGRVIAVEVIDSNFVGGAGNEIIGRHLLTTSGSGTSDLDNYIALKLPYVNL